MLDYCVHERSDSVIRVNITERKKTATAHRDLAD